MHDRVHAVRKRILPTRHSDEQPIRTRERQSAPPPRDDEGTPNEYAQRTSENHLARIVVYTLWPSRPRQNMVHVLSREVDLLQINAHDAAIAVCVDAIPLTQ